MQQDMDKMTAMECGEWYGNRLKNLVMFTDRDTLEIVDVQMHLAKLAELANFYVGVSNATQHKL